MNSSEFSKQIRQRTYSCPVCDVVKRRNSLPEKDERKYEIHLMKFHGLER